jgi:hypothetical protein
MQRTPHNADNIPPDKEDQTEPTETEKGGSTAGAPEAPTGPAASRVQEYKQRLENLLVDAQSALDRQAPDVLDKMAATARNVAQRLDDMAGDARGRAEDKEATPESAGTSDPASKPPGESPTTSTGPGTAGT